MDLTYQLIDRETGFVSDSLVAAILTIQRHVEMSTPARTWELTLTQDNGAELARIRVNGLRISLRALEQTSWETGCLQLMRPDSIPYFQSTMRP